MAISVELKQARRDHILDTARKLIGRRDVSGFSMAELAEHAGVSPATPYNLVGSKPEILNALIRFEVKDFASSWKRARSRPISTACSRQSTLSASGTADSSTSIAACSACCSRKT